ncbi:unnamed protein product [Rotaria sp. Silwood1]|nr:unnamed protein product [Rotaria sp. Silwood1]
MVDNINIDEQISNRRSKRSCRLSIVKSEPLNIEQKENKLIINEIEIDEEDPPDLFQLGDIFWVHVSGNPWWPALIYGSYYEDYIHTKIVKTPRRPKKRIYFVYFFGPAFEYTWTNANALIAYSGLDEFIKQAEISVQKATKKIEQETLANRYQLKVSANKRVDWDKAIAEADEALKLTREQRIENFAELLKNIFDKAEKNKSTRKRQSSVTGRQSRKTLSPSTDKSSKRSSVKRQKTKSTSISITLLHVGLPILTEKDEKKIVNNILDHSKQEELTLDEALSFVCQLVIEIIKENFHYDMSCIQIEWFYDFLLNHPDIILKYSHWFNKDIEVIKDDPIYLKQYKNQLKRKLSNDNILESSIFDILENEFQIGDIVWAKLNGLSWWPSFIYGCFLDNWKYVKPISKSGLPTKKQYFVYCLGSHFKHGWVHQTCLFRYKGFEEFINYSENRVEQATTKQTEEHIRKRFNVKISEALHPLWKNAIKEADEILGLPIDLRINAFEKMLYPLLAGTKYSIPQQGNKINH